MQIFKTEFVLGLLMLLALILIPGSPEADSGKPRVEEPPFVWKG